MKQSNHIPATHEPSSKPLLPPRKPEYVYHWDRIFGVILLALLLLGLTAYGIQAWFATSPEAGPDMAETLPEKEAATFHQQPDLNEEPIRQAAEEDISSVTPGVQEILPAQFAETTDAQLNTQETAKPLLEEVIIKEGEPAQQDVLDEPVESEPSLTEFDQPESGLTDLETTGEVTQAPIDPVDSESVSVPQTTDDISAMDSEDELAVPQEEISEEAPLNAQAEILDSATSPFQLIALEISEPKVKRFLLTRSVAQKEPQGELSDIRLNADGSAVVWSYSEVVEMNGSQLSYVWLHEGSQVARVPVNVRANRWRSYSNKIINQSMSGAWRVELQDGEGRLLASADFSLD